MGPYDCLWDLELKRICRNHVVIMWSRRIIKAVPAAGFCTADHRPRLLILPVTFWRAAVGRWSFDLPTSEVNLISSNVTVSHLNILPFSRETGELTAQGLKRMRIRTGKKRVKVAECKLFEAENLVARGFLLFGLGLEFLAEYLHVLAYLNVQNFGVVLRRLEIRMSQDF
jgi:hypothetical protein